MHLLLLLYFKSGYRLGLMFLSLFVNIKPSLIYLLGLSVVCTAAKVHQNNFFRLHQQNKSSTSKVKFRQSSNYCKRVFKAPKLLYVNKTKQSITSQKPDSRAFGKLVSALNLGKFAMPVLSNGPEVLPSATDKVVCWKPF